jgi:uncharacterized protein YfaQ (DUF2300 family)
MYYCRNCSLNRLSEGQRLHNCRNFPFDPGWLSVEQAPLSGFAQKTTIDADRSSLRTFTVRYCTSRWGENAERVLEVCAKNAKSGSDRRSAAAQAPLRLKRIEASNPAVQAVLEALFVAACPEARIL